VRSGGQNQNKIEALEVGKVNMRQYGLGLAYSPDSLEPLQKLLDRTWQSYLSAGLGEAASSNPHVLREHVARSIIRAADEGLPLKQIETQMTDALCQHLYAAVLAL